MSAHIDLEIEQGATFTADLSAADAAGDPIDLTGYTARMSIKRDARESTALLELTTANGRILITAATGLVQLVLTAAETAAISTWTRGVYDLELVSAGGDVTRLAEGAVSVSANVTV